MTERRPIIAANWKMFKTHLEAIQAVQKLSYLVDKDDAERVEIVICPPFTALRSVQTLIESDRLAFGLGAQNVFPEEKGAFTGEISPPMLVALKVQKTAKPHHTRLNGMRRISRDVSMRPCLGWPDQTTRSPGNIRPANGSGVIMFVSPPSFYGPRERAAISQADYPPRRMR